MGKVGVVACDEGVVYLTSPGHPAVGMAGLSDSVGCASEEVAGSTPAG